MSGAQAVPSAFAMDGKVAVVTGAGSRADGIGNGRAASILLARHGAKVALIDENTDWANETLKMIEAEGGSAKVYKCDVTDEAACQTTVAQITKDLGAPDILVNNVGIGGPNGTALDVDIAAWNQAMAVNVTSMVLMSRACLPGMTERGSGSIVNIASVAGILGGHPKLLYPTSKGAVVQMTRAMATHHGRDGVRVNCICPGMVYTPMVYTRGMDDNLRESRKNRSLLQVEGSGWDVGHAVAYLASDAARWVTGVILPVDAGATAGRHREG
ncbi:SDR family oxidoreductase [Pseudooceanicola sp.]|uniref:SDR family NAD(P)-dependent oxidoreductase n=1 Tax=Pseudooceanicola sp. TaxID=1914328 RepID=UPI00262657D6|nr:SDR family oxidoreductase [Pseudooceanicola sp.]MDF1857300.1 SDR family NAD(P)-dependent oxidoreductase [Pseudooceanicola sp.]